MGETAVLRLGGFIRMMFARKNSVVLFLLCVVFVFGTTACLTNASKPNGILVDPVNYRSLRPDIPVFREVSIHDPVVIKVDNTYYVFGSHLATAKSQDLIRWSQLSTNVSNYNRIFPNAKIELAEELSWAGTNTTWAKGIIKLNDLYHLYCCCLIRVFRGTNRENCIIGHFIPMQ